MLGFSISASLPNTSLLWSLKMRWSHTSDLQFQQLHNPVFKTKGPLKMAFFHSIIHTKKEIVSIFSNFGSLFDIEHEQHNYQTFVWSKYLSKPTHQQLCKESTCRLYFLNLKWQLIAQTKKDYINTSTVRCRVLLSHRTHRCNLNSEWYLVFGVTLW